MRFAWRTNKKGFISRLVVISLMVTLLIAYSLWPKVRINAMPDVLAIKTGVASYAPGDVLARTKTSITKSLGGSNYSVSASIGAIHYGGPGNWQPINNQIVSGVMSQDDYTFRLLQNTFNQGQIVEFASQGENVRFQPMALEWTNDLSQVSQISMPATVTGTTTNIASLSASNASNYKGIVSWANAYGSGRNFDWRTLPNRLAKTLTINSALLAPPDYIISGGNPVLRLNFIFAPSSALEIFVNGKLWDKSTRVVSVKTIEFRKAGVTIWGFTPALCTDSSQPKKESVVNTELRKSGNNLYVCVLVPYSWLQAATYPIVIDPTVSVSVGADDDDDWVYRAVTTRYTGGTWGRIGDSDGNNAGYGCSFRFTGVNIPDDSIATTAYLTIVANDTLGADTIRTDLCFENTNNPGQITSYSDHVGRTRTVATANDFTTNWTAGTAYQQPSMVTPLQDLIDDSNGTGSAIIVFFEDKDAESSSWAYRTIAMNEHATYAPAAFYAEYSAGGAPALTNDPSTEAVGTVNANSTYYAGSTPSNPVQDGECTFTMTNSGTATGNVTITGINPTGGVGGTLVATSPSSNEYRFTCYASGTNPANGVVLSTSPQAFVSSLAASATKKWDFKLETGTATDVTQKTETITLTIST